MESQSRDLEANEAKLIALQFLGQNIGELKDLDKRIINRTPSLNGLKLDPKKVIDSIPSKTIATKSVENNHTQIYNKPVPSPQVSVTNAHIQSTDNKILDKIYTKLCDIEKLLAKR